MKVLSVRQPFADLIVKGIKEIENRSWQTPYRGLQGRVDGNDRLQDSVACGEQSPHRAITTRKNAC
jgi:hypothetical protein